MSRRILGGLMAFYMLLTLFPAQVFGADASPEAWKEELSEAVSDAQSADVSEEAPEDAATDETEDAAIIFAAEESPDAAASDETPAEDSEEAPDEIPAENFGETPEDAATLFAADEVPAEGSEEVPDEIPAENSGETPDDAATVFAADETPAENSGETPDDAATVFAEDETPAEDSGEAPDDAATVFAEDETPAENSEEIPGETPAEDSGETPDDAATVFAEDETPAENSEEIPGEIPAENSGETPDDAATVFAADETPAENSGEAPDDAATVFAEDEEETTTSLPQTVEEDTETSTGTLVAEGSCGDNLNWSFYDDGTLTIEGSGSMVNYSSNYYIPWRSYSAKIQRVVVSKGVVSIGSYAFQSYTALASVTLPKGLTSIGTYAFQNCSALKSVALPEGLTSIGNYAFQNCAALASVTFSKGLTSIGTYAFSGDSLLESVALPDGVTSIGSRAFQNCSALKTLNIPESVTTISSDTFSGCNNLTLTVARGSYGRTYVFTYNRKHITSDAPEKIAEACGTCGSSGNSLFWMLYQDGTLAIEGSGKMYSYSGSDYVPWKNYRSQIKAVSIPADVTSIGNYAFYGLSLPDSVTLPKSLTSIGSYAFYNCAALKTLTIPESVTSIGDYAFSNCENLTLTVIRGSYGRTYAFNKGLKHVVSDAPEKIEIAGGSCGTNGNSLLWVFSEDGTLAFEGSGGMYTYSKADYVPWKDYRSKIKTVSIPEGVTSISSYALYGLSIPESIALPKSLTSIGSYAFYNCSALTTLTIPESVTSIGSYAFYNCAALKTLTIPKNVTSIGDYAFSNCENLTLTVIRDTYGRTYAFNKGLKHVVAGDSSEKVEIAGGSCGSSGSSLMWVLYEDGTLVFEGSGKMYGYSDSEYVPWKNYRKQIKTVSIPEGVTSIGSYAFYGLSVPESIVIPKSVTSIGNYAFSNCAALKTLTIPESVTSISTNAFSNSANLTLTVVRGSYGRTYVFSNNIKHVTSDAPEKVVTACGNCGSNGSGLLWTLSPEGTLTFEGSGTMYSYSNSSAVPWKNYKSQIKAVSIPEGVTSIGAYAFSGLSLPESVAIPESVTTIGNYAFFDCAALKTLAIPENVTSIGSSAFSNCGKLTLTVSRGSYARRFAVQNFLSYATRDETRAVMAQGSCGNTMIWVLFGDGTLELDGSGTMNSYSSATSVPWASHRDKVKSLSIGPNVTSIGNRAFSDCANLSAFTITANLKTLGDYAFSNCASLKALSVPETVTYIGRDAFSGCENLTLSVIRDTYGRTYAIENNLKHTLPDAPDATVTACGFCGQSGKSLIWLLYQNGTLAFEGEGAMANYSRNGLRSTAPWYSYNQQISALNIPNGVTRIGSYAFYGASEYLNDCRFAKLKALTLPDSVTAVGAYAFANCVALASVTLPKTLSSIETYAFSGCEALTALTIPSATSSIGNLALSNCPALTLTVYQDSYAQDYAIKNDLPHKLFGAKDDAPYSVHSGACGDKLYWMLYSDGVLQFRGTGIMRDYGVKSSSDPYTTAPWASYADRITSVIVPDGVSKIGAYAFYGNNYYATDYRFSKLKSVTLPKSLTEVSSYAFYNCLALSDITLPDALTSIGQYAFSGCEALTTLTLPKDLKSIQANAFSNCEKLTVKVYSGSYAQSYAIKNNVKHILIPLNEDDPAPNNDLVIASGTCGDKLNWLLYENGTLKLDGSGAMKDYGKKSDFPGTTAPWYEHREKIKSVEISEGVTKIGAYAFYGLEYFAVEHQFTNLASVTLPQSLTALGAYAFSGCPALKTLKLPDALTSIGQYAFSGCPALSELTIPKDLQSIQTNAFSDCPALTLSVYAGSYARFYALRYGVRHVVIGSKDIVLASGACDTLSSPNLYWLFYEDGRLVFEGSGKMRDYSSENHHTTAPWYSYHDRITSITIPSGVTKIGAYAFYGVKYYAQDYRFDKFSKLEIPESVTDIGSNAFKGCSVLSALTLSPYVSNIGSAAFDDCYNLTLTVYPDTPAKTYVLKNGLKHTVAGTGRTVISSGLCGDYKSTLYWLLYADGALEFEGSGVMADYLPASTNVAKKEGLWYRSNAPWYRYRDEIVSVKVPEGVTKIGAYAFYGVMYYTADHRFSALTSVTLPASLRIIGAYAFSGCVNLPSVALPDDLTTIDASAFAGCYGLKTLTVPQKVSSIGQNAFADCRALTLEVHENSKAHQYAKTNNLRHLIIETGELVPGSEDASDIPSDTPNDKPVVAPSNPFDVKRDAYAFVNEAKSFGYGSGPLSGKNYPIPYEAFELIFGDSVAGKSKFKQTQSGTWGGNCNGLSSTAALLYAGVTPLSAFKRDSVYALAINDSNGSLKVKTFIEAMQVAQYTDAFAKDYQGNRRDAAQLKAGKTLNDLLENVSKDVAAGKCDIIAVGKQGVGAHAILAYRSEKVSDAEYRLYVYDCNFPGDTRYVTLTAPSGGAFTRWAYNMGGYGEWTSDGPCFISYIPFGTIRSIWENRGNPVQTKEMLSVNVSNLSIQDISGREVASLQNGQLVTNSPEIYAVPELSMHWSDTNSIYLPKDLYTIVNKDDTPLQASMTDLNLEASVSTTSGNVTFAVDDASRENTVFIDDMAESDSYSVELSSSFVDSQYKNFTVKGTGNESLNGDTISISSAKDALALSSNISYQSLSINGVETKKEDYYTIHASVNGEGGTISPSGDVKVSPNEERRFDFVPKAGYALDHVEVNGTPVDLNGRAYYNLKAESDSGATITAFFRQAYGIGSAQFDRNARTVKVSGITNIANSVLTGIVFDGNGRFVGYAAQSLAAGATEGTLTFSAELPEQCVVKAFLSDENSKPLCNPIQPGQ